MARLRGDGGVVAPDAAGDAMDGADGATVRVELGAPAVAAGGERVGVSGGVDGGVDCAEPHPASPITTSRAASGRRGTPQRLTIGSVGLMTALPGPIVVALPTEDRRRAHDFYTEGLGLTATGEPGDDGLPEPLQLVVNEGTHLMLIPTGGFGWTVADRAVAGAGTSECLLSVTLASTEEVDALVERARSAGAEVVAEPERKPWGYFGTFADPDGHLWQAFTE